MKSRSNSRTAMVLVLLFVVLTLAFSTDCSSEWETVRIAQFYSLGLMKNGSWMAWETGRNEPGFIKKEAKWVYISSSHRQYSVHTAVGIMADGTLWEVGLEQLENGQGAGQLVPVQIGTDKDWVMATTNSKAGLGIKKDGSLWNWNYPNVLPTRIFPDHRWVKAFAGREDDHYIIREDGALFACRTIEEKKTLVPISPQIKWKELAIGSSHVLGLDINGRLFGWGSNRDGQLGDGTKDDKHIQTQIGNDIWKSIAAGSKHSIGVKADGSLFAWGDNFNGQLGDGTLDNQLSPVQIGKEYTWKSVAAGIEHTLGVTSEGYLMSWGVDMSSWNRGGTCGLSKPYYENPRQTPRICGDEFCFEDKCVPTCPPEYFSTAKNFCKKDLECEKGQYYDEETHTCVAKCHPSCATCEVRTTQCTSCPDGILLNLETHKCEKCNPECRTCAVAKDRCTSCPEGKHHHQIFQKCVDYCNFDCVDCFGTTNNCTSCYEGWNLTPVSANEWECQLVCDKSCKTCSNDPSYCTSCEPPLVIDRKQDGTSVCSKNCAKGCKTCEGTSTFCTSCEVGYLHFPQHKTCVLQVRSTRAKPSGKRQLASAPALRSRFQEIVKKSRSLFVRKLSRTRN